MTHPNIFINATLTLALTVFAAGCSGPDGTKDGAAKTEASEVAKDAGQGSDSDAPQFADDVERAVAVAKEIMKNPESADNILAKYELDRPGLDELIYKIASDPASRKRYSELLASRE